jgi:hypothetical protein
VGEPSSLRTQVRVFSTHRPLRSFDEGLTQPAITFACGATDLFNVTYQDYGDPTPMYIGTNYSVSVINQPRFQDGLLRFIYFPRTIAAQRFSQLPGIGKSPLH